MANNVNTQVSFYNLNEEAKAKLDQLMSHLNENLEISLFDLMHKEGYLTEAELDDYSLLYDRIGSKWCYVQDAYAEVFSLCSAWSFPEAGVEWLISLIADVCPDFVAVVEYEDEMPNFFGVVVYNKDGIVDSREDEGEEIVEGLEELYPDLKGLKDEEGNKSNEYWDMFSAVIWEYVHYIQHSVSQPLLSIPHKEKNT